MGSACSSDNNREDGEYSPEDYSLGNLVRNSVLNSGKGIEWRRTKTIEEILDKVFLEVDKGEQGLISKQGFLKCAALLEVRELPETLHAVFDRLDSNGLGFIPVTIIYELVDQSAGEQQKRKSVAAATRRKVRFTNVQSSSESGSTSSSVVAVQANNQVASAARERQQWRNALREFEENIQGERKARRLTKFERSLAEWSDRSEAWEEKLVRAEQRRHRLYKGIFPPHGSESSMKNGAGRFKHRGRRFAGGGMSSGNSRRTQYLESVAKDSTLFELQDITHFTVEDLKRLRERFFEQAMSTSLTVDKFCTFLTNEYPSLAGHQSLLLRLFTLFDTDGNGTVSFQEFIMGLTKTLKCSMDEKIHLMFSCIDLSSDGKINLQEFTHVVTKSQGDLQASIAYARDFFAFLDRDNSGTVSLEEFKRALQGNTKLFKSLVKALPLPSNAYDVIEELKGSSEKTFGNALTLDNLKRVYREYANLNKRSRKKNRPMSRQEFRLIMGKHFGLQRLDEQKLLDRLFDTFDTDNSNSVTFEEILRGLSLLISQQSESETDNEELLDFYFDLFDSDQKGGFLGSEIKNVLLASEDRLRSDYHKSQMLLHDLQRQSNLISEKELMSLSESHPELIQILRHNFR